MTWNPNAKYRTEVSKCRFRLMPYCVGMGLDIGCGVEKIKPAAIGIDTQGVADIFCDVAGGLGIFANNSFDFIFSSHCLEDLQDPEVILRDWWEKIKVGGNLVLNLPHKDFYPNMGTKGSNPGHHFDFVPEDIISLMNGFATYQILHNEVHREDDEYSFEMVFKKVSEVPHVSITVKDQPTKKALVIRYGGYGDMVIATPVLKRLKEDGYHVTLNTTPRALDVMKNNPNVDVFMMQEDDVIPRGELSEYWAAIGKDYDKVVNLSETLEVKFLTIHQRKDSGYYLPAEERRAMCGKDNYYDYALKVAGYEDVERPRGELFFDYREEAFCQKFRDRFKNYFLIMWSLSGSSMHKAWLKAEETALGILGRHKDIVILTVGDYACKLIEWRHPQSVSMIDEWGMRASMLMTKYVDLVIGPETGIINAAGCFDTPKIGLLTHSNKTNLTKHFKNDYSMQAHIDCSPCHRMIYPDNFRDCSLIGGGSENGGIDFCACGDAFSPAKVIKTVEEIYGYWHGKRRTIPLVQSRRPDVILFGPNGQKISNSRGITV